MRLPAPPPSPTNGRLCQQYLAETKGVVAALKQKQAVTALHGCEHNADSPLAPLAPPVPPGPPLAALKPRTTQLVDETTREPERLSTNVVPAGGVRNGPVLICVASVGLQALAGLRGGAKK